MNIIKFQNINRQVVSDNYDSIRFLNNTEDSKIELPMLYRSKSECSGCTACFTSCPKSGFNYKKNINIKEVGEIEQTGAITMLPDRKGYLYPVIDASLCIGCHQCIWVCPFK